MKITNIDIVKGSPTYMTTRQLRDYFDMGRTSMFTRIVELKEEIREGRYPKQILIEDGHFTWVNFYAFADYLANRKFLLNKNLRKTVEPFCMEDWKEIPIVKVEGSG